MLKKKLFINKIKNYMADLSWKLKEIIYGCEESGNWISVSPTEGSGDSQVSVSVSSAESPDDCQSALIIFSASTGVEEEVKVARCVPECSCSSLNFTPNDSITTQQLPPDSTTYTAGTYNNNVCAQYVGMTTDGIVLTEPKLLNGTATFVITSNTNENPRSGWYRFLFNGETCVENNVYQSGMVNVCRESTTCDDAVITPSEMSFPTTGGSSSYTITFGDCWELIETTKNGDWFSVDEDNKVVTVSKNDNNQSDMTGDVIFKLYNSSNTKTDTKTISIRQSHDEPPGYNVFTFSNDETEETETVSYESGEYSIGVISKVNGVKTGFDVSFSCDWIENNYEKSETYLKVFYEKNTSTSRRSCAITLTQEGTGKICILNLRQNPSGQGEDIFIWSTGSDFYNDWTDESYISLKAFESKLNGASVNGVMSSNAAWIITESEMYPNGNQLRPNIHNNVYFTGINESGNPRSGILTLTQAGGTKQISVKITQNPVGVHCGVIDFTFTDENYNPVSNPTVYIGNPLYYKYHVEDPACTVLTTFDLYTNDSTYIMTSTADTQVSGEGKGKFITNNCPLGIVKTDGGGTGTYNATIIRAEYIYIKADIYNTYPENLYMDSIDFLKNGTVVGTVGLGGSYQFDYCNHIVFNNNSTGQCAHNSLRMSGIMEGVEFDEVIVKDTIEAHKRYRCTYLSQSSELIDGMNIRINIISIIE